MTVGLESVRYRAEVRQIRWKSLAVADEEWEEGPTDMRSRRSQL